MTRRYYFIFALFLSPSLYGFTDESPLLGSIEGKVYDKATKESLPGVNIILVGSRFGIATDDQGHFTISRIPIGTYEVKVSAVGYAPMVQSAVTVSSEKHIKLDFALSSENIEMNEVEVVSAYVEKSAETPVSTLHLSKKEINWRGGGLQDPIRAVTTLPGVAQTRADRNDLIVRGGAPSENLVVVDGCELPSISHFATQGAGGGSLSFINFDFIEGLFFSKGGFGARYGDKLSSVLLLNLREGRTDRFASNLNLSATQFGLATEGPLSNNSSALFSIRRSYLDLVFKSYGFSFVPEFWDYLGKVNVNLGTSDKLSILSTGAFDRFKLLNATSEQRFLNSGLLFGDQNHFSLGAQWLRTFANGFTTVNLSALESNFSQQQQDTELNPMFTSASTEREFALRAELDVKLSDVTELTGGIQGKLVYFRSHLFVKPQGSMYGESIQANDTEFDDSGVKGGIFLQIAQTVENLKLGAGLRADYFNMIQNNFVLAPRFSATYVFSPLTSISASLGTYYQSPSYIWLVATSFNRQLTFLRGDQFVLSGEHWVNSDIRVTLEGYTKHYKDYPTSLSRPYLSMLNTGAGLGGTVEGFQSFGLDSMVNKATGKGWGLELFVEKKASTTPWYGSLSLSYSHSSFVPLDGIERLSSYDQRWVVSGGLGYTIENVWEISTRFRYYTGRPYTSFSNGSLAERYNTARVEANHNVDIRVSRQWQLSSMTISAYIDISNVYNRTPVDAPIFNSRNQREEQAPMIGILPTVGVKAEF